MTQIIGTPVAQPAQQHLNRWTQQSMITNVSNSTQTALAEARLEAYLTYVKTHPPIIPPQWIQQPKNIF